MSTEKLNKSSDRVRESRRTMLETEDLGVSILSDLHQQRQSLLHADNTVRALINLDGICKYISGSYYACVSQKSSSVSRQSNTFYYLPFFMVICQFRTLKWFFL